MKTKRRAWSTKDTEAFKALCKRHGVNVELEYTEGNWNRPMRIKLTFTTSTDAARYFSEVDKEGGVLRVGVSGSDFKDYLQDLIAAKKLEHELQGAAPVGS